MWCFHKNAIQVHISTRCGKTTNNIYFRCCQRVEAKCLGTGRAASSLNRLGPSGGFQTSCFPSLKSMGISMEERKRLAVCLREQHPCPFSFHSHQYLGTLGKSKLFPKGKRLGGPETVLCAYYPNLKWHAPLFSSESQVWRTHQIGSATYFYK